MNEVMTKSGSPANPGPVRTSDYTGILPSQKILEMLGSGEIRTMLMPFEHDQIQPPVSTCASAITPIPWTPAFSPARA